VRYERTLRILWPAQAAYVVGRRGDAESVRRQRAAKRWARGGRRSRSRRVARRAPCRAQKPSARSQPSHRQSLNVEFIKQFRLTLSHEGTTHCDLSKLRELHTKRRMNEGNAKKGSENQALPWVSIVVLKRFPPNILGQSISHYRSRNAKIGI